MQNVGRNHRRKYRRQTGKKRKLCKISKTSIDRMKVNKIARSEI